MLQLRLGVPDWLEGSIAVAKAVRTYVIPDAGLLKALVAAGLLKATHRRRTGPFPRVFCSVLTGGGRHEYSEGAPEEAGRGRRRGSAQLVCCAAPGSGSKIGGERAGNGHAILCLKMGMRTACGRDEMGPIRHWVHPWDGGIHPRIHAHTHHTHPLAGSQAHSHIARIPPSFWARAHIAVAAYASRPHRRAPQRTVSPIKQS